MLKFDAEEAKPIVQRAMKSLLLTVSERGRPGSDLRTAVGSMMIHLDVLLQDDAIGEPLAECFDLVRKAGATLATMFDARVSIAAETPLTLGGKLIKNGLINFCFATTARIMTDVTFTSREDVERIKRKLNIAFDGAEEIAADAMDSATYMTLVRLHAAASRFMIETARPLPRMLIFRFAAPLSTLHAAHRLYDDAGRADELRNENKVVHPAFMKQQGRALSA